MKGLDEDNRGLAVDKGGDNVIIDSERQALGVAVEMERRAIRIYERALLVAQSDEVKRGIQALLADERRHLQRFSAMREECGGEMLREKLLVDAVASEVLFPGGVMEMERADGLTTLRALYEFAANSEREAVERYTSLAGRCQRQTVREAFLSVAREESAHLVALTGALENIK